MTNINLKDLVSTPSYTLCSSSALENVTRPYHSFSSILAPNITASFKMSMTDHTTPHTTGSPPPAGPNPSVPRHFPSLPMDTIPNSGSAGAAAVLSLSTKGYRVTFGLRPWHLPQGTQRSPKPGKGAPHSGTQPRGQRKVLRSSNVSDK